jgi:hypothetical protein
MKPALPASGSGVLCAITFRPKAFGFSRLNVPHATLVDGDINSIPAIVTAGGISVPQKRILYLPVNVKMTGLP